MKKSLFVCAALVLLAAAPAVRADDEAADRAAVVHEMLNRSRLLEDAQFTVPLEYYRQYLRLLAEEAGAESRPPVDHIDELASYHLKIPADRKPTLAVRRRIRIFRPDRNRPVPVLPAKWSWEKVTIDGQPAELTPLDGWLCIAPEQAGTVEITAELSLKEVPPDGGEVAMDVRPAVRNLVQVDSPQPWQVRAIGAVGRLKGSAEAGTHGQLALEPVKRLLVTFSPPPPEYERPPRYEIKGDIAWNFDLAVQQVSARLLVAVADGRSDRIELLLPPEADRLTVTGPDVREVQGSRGAAMVHLRQKVTGQTWLQVQYELPKRQGGLQSLGRLAVRDGHWTDGTLVVTNTAGGSEVVPESTAGLEDMALIDIAESASALLAGKAVMAYRITSRNWSAKVDVVDLGEGALRETIADVAHYDLLLRGDGAVMCKATFEIRNRSRQFLRLELPPGAIVLATRVNEKSRPMAPVAGRPGVYLLPMERSAASVEGLVSFPVEVVAMYRVGSLKGNDRMALPVPQIDLPIAYAWAELRVPDGLGKRRWSGVLHRVDEYASKTAKATLGYGRAEKAQPTDGKREPTHIEDLEPVVAEAAVAFMPPKAAPRDQQGAAALLAPNYYRAGQDFYNKADYANAAESFRKVLQLAPDSSQADNAKLYLANPIMPGEETGAKDRSQRAALSQVRQDIAASNVSLLERQRGFLEKGQLAERKGKQAEAVEQFEAAQAMSKKLVAQGVAEYEQKALLRDVQEQLSQAQQQRSAEVEELKKQVKQLKSRGQYDKALEVAKRARTGSYQTGDAKESQQDLDEEIEELVVEAARQHGAVQAKSKDRLKSLDADMTDLRDSNARGEPTDWSREGRAAQGQPATPEGGVQAGADRRSVQRQAEMDLPARIVWQRVPMPQTDGVQTGADRSYRIVPPSSTRAPSISPEPSDEWGMALARPAATPGRPEGPESRRREETGQPVPRGTETAAATLWSELHAYPEGRELAEKLTRQDVVQGGDGLRESERRDLGRETPVQKRFTQDVTAPVPDFGRTVARMQLSEALEPGKPPATGQPQLQTRVYRLGGGDAGKTKALVEKLLADSGGKAARPLMHNLPVDTIVIDGSGSMVVTAPKEQQDQVGGLLKDLEEARGPQVELGSNIAGQRAKGVIKKETTQTMDDMVPTMGDMPVLGGLFRDGREAESGAARIAQDKQFQEFVRRNYSWAYQGREGRAAGAGGGGTATEGIAGFGAGSTLSHEDFYRFETLMFTAAGSLREAYGDLDGGVRDINGVLTEMARKTYLNLDQKVAVNSINLNVDEPTANGLGVFFQTGNNGVSFTVADEAQVRTLLELDARRSAAARVVDNNEWFQDAIVGTDALLANAWAGNVKFAGERSNTLDVNGNTIALPHEKYILINNGRYLTAVRAGQMQHWTEQAKSSIRFAEVPQTLDVPRVGRVVKLEKRLVKPTDRLVIRCDYVWKGATE